MMRRELIEPFENLPYFTIEGLKQLLGDGPRVDQRARLLLARRLQAGQLISLKRGLYMHRRFFEQHRHEAGFMPAVSAILLPQSYLSLEAVLQRAGILTEATYPISAVTLKNTRTFENRLGVFTFRHIKPLLYTGFNQHTYYGITFFRATPAKALFDYLYLRPLPRSLRSRGFDLAEELRLNLEEFTAGQRLEFGSYVELSASEKMEFISSNLRKNIWQP